MDWQSLVFQSTPPVKAATSLPICARTHRRISIHAAREGGDESALTGAISAEISIHAAREGGDVVHVSAADALIIFQSTPPVKAATAVVGC